MNRNTQLKLYSLALLVFIAIFSVITTSYAWFTIAGRTQVENMKITVTLGKGLELSLDRETWKDTLTVDEIAKYYNRYYLYDAFSLFGLDHVTTEDGKNFTTLRKDEDYIFDVPNYNGFLTIKLYMRSSRKFIVYLSEELSVSGTTVLFDSLVDEGVKIEANPSYAIRLSFESSDGLWVYEPNADRGFGGYGGENNAAVDYFNRLIRKYDGESAPVLTSPLTEPGYNKIDKLGTDGTPLTTLRRDSIENPYYESEITVRIWLEGWDADCFDAILNKTVTIYLPFVGKRATN